MDENTRKFILQHEKEDIRRLSLTLGKRIDLDKDFVLRQINGRQKVKSKITSFYENPEILYPFHLSVEQSSSELTAKYKAGLVGGESLLDLTGGFGVDFAFLSSKFKKNIYVERQSELCELSKHNFKVLGLKNYSIYNEDSVTFLKKSENSAVIFIDPHRRNDSGRKMVSISDCEPNLLDIKDLLVAKSDKCLVKLSPMLDLQQAIKDLNYVSEVHILSVENECKELLLLLQSKTEKMIVVNAINFQKNGKIQSFAFNLENEISARYEIGKITKYLYEPNASVMKSGAFKSVAQNFGIHKLNVNTHLYSSESFVTDFPGRVFEVIEVLDYSKNSIKILKTKYKKANISTRNFPESVEEIRSKTKLNDGGDIYLFACRDYQDKTTIIICSKI